jgi:hypothetical protein
MATFRSFPLSPTCLTRKDSGKDVRLNVGARLDLRPLLRTKATPVTSIPLFSSS